MTGVSEAKAAVDTISVAMDTGSKALDLYNKALDQVIPWNTFDQTLLDLSKHQADYSDASAVIVGRSKTLLLNSRDDYHVATQSVYEWCDVAVTLLTAYLALFTNFDAERAAAQKEILLRVLDEGVDKLSRAQDKLSESSKSFNSASGELSTLSTQLSNDFSTDSNWYDQQVDKLRKQAYGGAAAGIALGPFGLAISYSIAAGVLEGKLIPELHEKCEQVKMMFDGLQKDVTDAVAAIDAAKRELRQEVEDMGKLKSDTESTELFVRYDDIMLGQLKDSARKLIRECGDFMKHHR